jgi:hypothetical protein
MSFHGTTMTTAPFNTDDPLDRRWRSAVLWTIHDLKNSAARHRTLSLQNICRLFERRWHAARPSEDTMRRGRELGREFLQNYYLAHQPFRQGVQLAHNGH